MPSHAQAFSLFDTNAPALDAELVVLGQGVAWLPSHVYAALAYAVPTVGNDRYYRTTGGGTSGAAEGGDAWLATNVYSALDVVVPTASNGFKYRTTAGGTSGGSEPTWPTTIGQTVSDGTVVWTCLALVWPLTIGATWVDGSVTWTCIGTNDFYPAKGTARRLWVGSAGNVVYDAPSGTTLTATVGTGKALRTAFTRVRRASTTATGLVALY